MLDAQLWHFALSRVVVDAAALGEVARRLVVQRDAHLETVRQRI